MQQLEQGGVVLASLWKSFFAICCFRNGPQDLPVSREFLVLCLLAYGLSGFLLTMVTQPIQIALLSGLIDTTLLVVISYIFLRLWRFPERVLQTSIALSGTGILFNVGAIPVFFLLGYIGNDTPLALLLFLFVMSLVVWNIGVMAHIMRHALSSSFAMGVLVALIYVLLINAVINSLLPQQSIP